MPPRPDARYAFATYLAGRQLDGRRISEPLLEAMHRAQETMEEAAPLLVHGRGNVLEDIALSGGASQKRTEAAQRFAYLLARAVCEGAAEPDVLDAFDKRIRPDIDLDAREYDPEQVANIWPNGYFEALAENKEHVPALVAYLVSVAVTTWFAGAGNCTELAPLVQVGHGQRLRADESVCIAEVLSITSRLHQWGRLKTPHGLLELDLWLNGPGRSHVVEDVDHAHGSLASEEKLELDGDLAQFAHQVLQTVRKTFSFPKRGAAARQLFADLLARRSGQPEEADPERPVHDQKPLLHPAFRRRVAQALDRLTNARADAGEVSAGGLHPGRHAPSPLILGLRTLEAARLAGIEVRPSGARAVEQRISQELRDLASLNHDPTGEV